MGSQATAIDLFCGAGGLSLGLARAGFSVLRAYDHWEPAVATHRANFQHEVKHCDIHSKLTLPWTDLIVGGPPCQGFSSAGRRREDDDRNSLISIFARLVATMRPRAFLFENVEGFLTAANGRFVFELLSPLVQAGYRIHCRKINAANFAVPQHRKRVIVVGGLGWDPAFPSPTHTAHGAPGALLAADRLPHTQTVGQALAGLPAAKEHRAAESEPRDHTFAPLCESDLARARLLQPGQCMRDLPQEHWHPSYARRAFRRVMDGTPTERRGGAPAGLRRLRSDEPSKTITGGAQSELLHPDEDRPLTIRECARLQTFPDDFRIVATSRDAIQLLGNAVPPVLAQRLGEQLSCDFQRAASAPRMPGALLSFVPTLSSGSSPILREVVAEVARRFRPTRNPTQLDLQWA